MIPDTQRQTGRLRALAESAPLFAEASIDLPRLLGVVARRFSELVGEAVNIRLIEGGQLVPVATYHPDPEVNEYLRTFHDTIALRVGEGISGKVIETGEPYFMPELDLERFKQNLAPSFVPVFEKVGISGIIVARLRARGINLGYLSLFRTSKARGPYSEDDLHLVQDLADRAALAIDNSRLVADLEHRVAERTQALESANRELEAFALSVSHDLRSPLQAIDGFSYLLERRLGGTIDGKARDALSEIRNHAQRMNKLIEALLRLSRLGHRGLQPVVEVDMRRLVDAVLVDIQAANPALAFELRIGELPTAVGNTELLRQVWANLLDNAAKYSRRCPVVVIEVDGVREGGELRYRVTDHGAGFDSACADKLFGVFERLHRDTEFEGIGAGLALVHRIIARHGGRVWAEGRVGEGATFHFALPERGPARATIVPPG